MPRFTLNWMKNSFTYQVAKILNSLEPGLKNLSKFAKSIINKSFQFHFLTCLFYQFYSYSYVVLIHIILSIFYILSLLFIARTYFERALISSLDVAWIRWLLDCLIDSFILNLPEVNSFGLRCNSDKPACVWISFCRSEIWYILYQSAFRMKKKKRRFLQTDFRSEVLEIQF